MNQEFYDQLKFEAELKAFDQKTVSAYQDSIERFEKFHDGATFDKLGVNDVKVYIHHLLTVKKLAPNSVNRHLAAIRFFYRYVLHRHDYMLQLPNVRVPEKIPVILTEEEMAHLIDSVHNVKYKAILMLAYSAGLRNSDVRKLRIQDIDSKRMVITIRNGKGNKDRQALLSELALKALRTYWRLFRVHCGYKSDMVFIPTKNPKDNSLDRGMSHTAVGYVIKVATEASGIKKKSLPMSSAIPLLST